MGSDVGRSHAGDDQPASTVIEHERLGEAPTDAASEPVVADDEHADVALSEMGDDAVFDEPAHAEDVTASLSARRPWYLPRFRPLMLRLHRWVSFAILPLVVFYFVTGLILVLPISSWAQPSDWVRTTGSQRVISFERAVEIATEQHPGERVAWVSDYDRVVWVVQGPDEDGIYTITFIDPTSGRVNATLTDPEWNADSANHFLAWVQNAHDHAFGGEGAPGYLSFMAAKLPLLHWRVNSTVAVLAAVGVIWLAIGGLVLWWPGLRRWRRGFRVRIRSFYILNFDLHHVLGFLAVPFVMMWGLTAVAFIAPKESRSIWNAVTFSDSAQSNESFSNAAMQRWAEDPKTDIGVDTARRIAQAVRPGELVKNITYPDPANGMYFYSFELLPSWSGRDGAFLGAGTTVDVGQGDGAAVAWPDPNSPFLSRFWDTYSADMHYGVLVSYPTRLVWVFFAVLPLILVFTGIVMWLRRFRSRRARRSRSAASA